MKIKNIILIIVLALIGAGGWFLLTNHSTDSVHSEHEADLYYCPMHPHVTSDRPGTCPICFMKLVKKEQADTKQNSLEAVADYSTVKINPRQQQLMGIRTIPVQRKMLTKTIHAYGYVAHDMELYDAQFEYIDAWRAYYAYNFQRLVKEESQQEWSRYYLNETKNRKQSRQGLDTQKRLIKADYTLRNMGFTDTQFLQLQQIKSNQPWIPSELIFFKEGHPTWIYAQIPEIDLGFVAVGQKAVVTIPTYDEKSEGMVRNVALMIDPVTRTTQVRIELLHYRGELPANMYVNVALPVEFDEMLVVPHTAILDTGLKKNIFVQTEEGVFEPREIQTGIAGDGWVSVTSGVNEGEKIVVSGNFLLDSESRLNASLSGGHND